MLKKILLGLLVLVLGIILITPAFLPEDVNMSRFTTIDAPAPVVFGLVNELTMWEKWSPWSENDPNMEITYTETTSGEGSSYSWKSEVNDVGTMTITDIKEFEEISTDVQFGEQGGGDAKFTFVEEDGKTTVTWSFHTDVNEPPYIGRLFGLFLEPMLGPQYERGLERLKELAESMPKLPEIAVEEEMLEGRHFIMAKVDSVPYDSISAVMGREYGRIGMFLGSEGLEIAGMPMAIWEEAMKGEMHSFACGLPVAEVLEVPEGMMFKTIEGKFLTTVHTGPYDTMDETYEQLFTWLAAKGYGEDGMMWEEYINDPGEVAAEAIQTKIYYAVN